jgi:uncharacterized membrane protein (DUF106 family)
MYGITKFRSIMSEYKQPTKASPLLYFMVFIGIVSITFGIFFTALARPLAAMKSRMHNTETDWELIQQNIVKIKYGDSVKDVEKLIGKPDNVQQASNQKLYIYQKYGVYKPKLSYFVEFREDTLYGITSE